MCSRVCVCVFAAIPVGIVVVRGDCDLETCRLYIDRLQEVRSMLEHVGEPIVLFIHWLFLKLTSLLPDRIFTRRPLLATECTTRSFSILTFSRMFPHVFFCPIWVTVSLSLPLSPSLSILCSPLASSVSLLSYSPSSLRPLSLSLSLSLSVSLSLSPG